MRISIKTILCVLSALIVLLAVPSGLTGREIAALDRSEQQIIAKSVTDSGLGFPKRPRLTAPLDALAPTIDGKINEDEWADATCFFGLVDGDTGFLSEKDFVGYIKSDGKKLYLAFKTKVLHVELLNNNYVKHDSDVCYDDSWEVYFYPMEENKEYYDKIINEGGGNFYQIIVNSIGTTFDWYQRNVKWDGRWEIEQRLERPDIWEAELAIPLEDIGMKEPAEGEQYLFGFFFNQKSPQNRSFCWTTQMGVFANPARAAILSFSRNKPIVRLKDLGKPRLGLITPTISGN